MASGEWAGYVVWRYIIYIATMAYIVVEVEMFAAFPDCNLHYRQTVPPLLDLFCLDCLTLGNGGYYGLSIDRNRSPKVAASQQ